MIQKFTAIYKKRGKKYVGWVEEIPGVNTQGDSLKQTKENLEDALSLILDVNKVLASKEVRGKIIREPISIDRA